MRPGRATPELGLECFALRCLAIACALAGCPAHAQQEARAKPQTSQYDAPPESESSGGGATEEIQTQEETPRHAKSPKKRPAMQAYKLLFYDNDFSYLNEPSNTEFYLGDIFKQWRVGPRRRSKLDLGGEYRLRDQHEFHLSGRNLSGLSDDFLLQRTRFYGNLKLGDAIRLFGEGLDSATSFQRHPPLASDNNGMEAVNLFADLRLIDAERGELWGRIGRQELSFGAYRLVAPSEFANILRTFDGVKLFWKGEKWNVEGFWARPVAFGQLPTNQIAPGQIDMTQSLYGVWSTYNPTPEAEEVEAEAQAPRRGARLKQTFDFYYLGFNVYDAPISAAYPVDASFQTIGSRWLARQGNLRWELQGSYQFGRYGAQTQSAGMTVSGIGYENDESRAKPKLWLYYDWASGGANPGNGRHGTFNQLLPWTHRYFGYMDLVGRQNIQDLNLLCAFSPTEKSNFTLGYHIFHLASARDALYNATGTPIRVSPTGAAGTYVGQELDLIYQIVVNARADVLFGYSHFFAGTFVKRTNPVGVSGNADFYYSQWTWRF